MSEPRGDVGNVCGIKNSLFHDLSLDYPIYLNRTRGYVPLDEHTNDAATLPTHKQPRALQTQMSRRRIAGLRLSGPDTRAPRPIPLPLPSRSQEPRVLDLPTRSLLLSCSSTLPEQSRHTSG